MRRTLAALILLVLTVPVYAQENCRGWINAGCCCTNGACHDVAPGEVEQIGENLYYIPLTGERIARTGWSKDGTFVRCSYAPNPNGGWLIGPQYRTSCLYVPLPAF